MKSSSNKRPMSSLAGKTRPLSGLSFQSGIGFSNALKNHPPPERRDSPKKKKKQPPPLLQVNSTALLSHIPNDRLLMT